MEKGEKGERRRRRRSEKKGKRGREESELENEGYGVGGCSRRRSYLVVREGLVSDSIKISVSLVTRRGHAANLAIKQPAGI